MLENSAQAPTGWEIFETEELIRQRVLEAEPDVVLYQELPGMVPFVETHAMLKANPRTHSGNLATLVTYEVDAMAPQVTTVDGCAVLATFAEPELTIANVHFASGKAAADDRLVQIAAVVESSPTDALLIVGDTNTRVAEVDELVELGLTSTTPPKPTWNSRSNRFRARSPEFTAYFTRWIASPDLVVSDVHVWDEPVHQRGARFHVSDHFALGGRVQLRR